MRGDGARSRRLRSRRRCAARTRAASALRALAPLLALAAAVPGTACAETFGSISGVVREASSGNPIQGIDACAFSLNAELLSESEREHAMGCATTDATGSYTISELRPESYVISFQAPLSSSLNFIPQLYDEKPASGEPTPVAVPAGGAAPNIDAKLAPGARISGRVTVAGSGAPIESALVAVTEGTSENEQLVGLARTDANGEYAVSGLPTGTDKVLFIAPHYEPQVYDGKSQPSEATLVSVTAPELTAPINAALTPSSEASVSSEGPATEPGKREAAGAPGAPGVSGTKVPGGPEPPKLSRPEGELSVLGARVALRGSRVALVRLACVGHDPCRAKLTLRTRRTVWVKHHRRVVSVAIGTSSVLSIPGARDLAAKVSLNAEGRKLLREHGGVIDAVLTLVTPGRTREEHVVLSAAAASTHRNGPSFTG